jgi:hypothetical protein
MNTGSVFIYGRAIVQAGNGRPPVGFVVDKVALGQIFYEYFDFPCQLSFF